MRLYDALVKGMVMYGAEIWGWQKRDEKERVHERYLRWCLGVDYNTPAHSVLSETGRYSMSMAAPIGQ